MSERINSRERDAAIQSLRSGVVPRLGIRHIQVGRAAEVAEAIKDIDRIANGGTANRMVIATYGAGKSFLLSLIRAMANERKLVVMSADLSPERRLHATGGQARLLCAELVRSMSTRAKPDGGALSSVVERFIAETQKYAAGKNIAIGDAIRTRLDPVREMVCGYDFADVVVKYWEAFEEGDEIKKAAALRWLRCEYTLKTEARNALGVRAIVDDAGIYDHLKAMACLVRLAGYEGVLVILDECVNLYKLVNAQARNANYELILKILNDCLQGGAERIGFYYGGTPELLLDTRRGLYSYEALRSRLAENSFAKDGMVDLSGAVIRLQPLTPEELYVLLSKLRLLWAGGDTANLLVPDQALEAFLNHCSRRIGEAYFRTPRNTIKAFLDFLAIWDQNRSIEWADLIGTLEIHADAPAPLEDVEDLPPRVEATTGGGGQTPAGDDLASFRL
jgi:hypothetical protein